MNLKEKAVFCSQDNIIRQVYWCLKSSRFRNL